MGNLSGSAQAINKERNELRFYSGQQRHYAVDCSSGNVTLAGEDAKCRYAKVDVAGTIKISYKSDNGVERTEPLNVSQGELVRIANITTVYQYYIGTTPCTSKVFTDDGELVVGIKLCY